jgi:iron complex transport system ATP-binding protein
VSGAELVVSGLAIARGGRRVVEGVSFAAAPGRVTALIGPNGAGKSTLLKACLGLLPVAGGGARLGGDDLLALPRAARARRIAYVPQRSLLAAGLPVRAVVAMGRYAHGGPLARPRAVDRQAVDAALAATDALDFAERRFDQLSTGEAQRVLVARALATGAGTILMDEPTAGLDLGHALTLLGLIRRLAAEGRTLLVVLHHLDEVREVADRALLLVAGRLQGDGAVAEVLTAEALRSAFGVEGRPGGVRWTLAQGAP